MLLSRATSTRCLLLTAALLTALPCARAAKTDTYTVVAQADFDSGTLPGGRWHWGAYNGGTLVVSRDRKQNAGNSAGSVRGTYPVPVGDRYVLGTVDLSDLKTREIYLEFDARMPLIKHGLKFLKIFGVRDANGYANATIQPDYTGIDNGSFPFIGFGDGTSTENDFANIIKLDGTDPSLIGRSYGIASVATPQSSAWPSTNWKSDWHHFRVKVKFNSGTTADTEISDGEFFLEIDGTVYVAAKGLYNRHYSNGPIASVSFFDWSQAGQQPFEVWYDNIVISTGGFAASKSTNTNKGAVP